LNKVFEKYKNFHKGERAFLIANGPSLNDIDLDLLKDETTFAMNRISLKYSETSWRPTYYLFSSTNVRPDKPWHKEWRSSVTESISDEKITSFIADQFRSYIDPYMLFPNVKWFDKLSEKKPDIHGNISEICFSTDVVERIDKTGTSMNLALQLCYYMGFSEIVLVGADLGWSKDTGTKSDPNHFDKTYTAEILKPDKANNQMRNVHSLSLKYFNKRDYPVSIYNASSSTVLDVYPIIDFEAYINDGKVIIREAAMENAKKFWNKKPQYYEEK
jgi:hypothetical protein